MFNRAGVVLRWLFKTLDIIFSMSKAAELRKVSLLVALLQYAVAIATVWGCHHFDPWDGSYQYAIDKTYNYSLATVVLIAISWAISLFIIEPPPPTAWWEDVHVMD